MALNSDKNNKTGLTPYLSPAAAWAFALGTSIGWGSLVVTNNAYLSQAGSLGSILGLVIGMVITLFVSRSYHYMMNGYPDAGGAYAFAKEAFGYDHGFLTAWFLALTYLAIFWANVTSLPLFARYFFGDMFRFGFLYTIFGYDVYLGEALLAMAAIVLTALICIKLKKAIANAMVVMAVLLVLGITVCFVTAVVKHSSTSFSYEPAYVPDKSHLFQIIRIACISPWAFIGFENISHSTEEFSFARSKAFRVLVISVVSATALYVFVFMLSVTAYPPEYRSWLEYIRALGGISGMDGLPAFYAARHYMGNAGVTILILSLLALILTSLIGNIIALSRLFYALAKDDIIPQKFAELNNKQIPWRSIILAAALSLLIPFLGRAAIGWIVDVTTIGATMVYGFVSASAFKIAKRCGDKSEMVIGLTGMIFVIAIGAALLLPNLFSAGTFEKETYFLFVVWTILGFAFFRYILKADTKKRFGKSIIVWIALLSLVLSTSLIWLSQSTISSTANAMISVQQYYDSTLGVSAQSAETMHYMENIMDNLRRSNLRSMIIVIIFFVLSVSIMLSNYSLMAKRANESEMALMRARNIVNIDRLTGVKSKHAFDVSEKDFNERIKAKTAEDFAVVVCDINGLKYINDTFGHKVGDEYIRKASRVICEIFKHSPVFRIGGDEFAVIMTGRDHAVRSELMNTLDKYSEEAIRKDEVVISAGMADYSSGEDENIHAVFERADVRMYNRKKELKSMGAWTRE